jgi:hypothetical protein
MKESVFHNNYCIAYVASTLPIKIIDQQIKEWNIKIIILQGKSLFSSYIFLKNKHPDIIIRYMPKKISVAFLYLLLSLAYYKLINKKIFFFHECCWPFFDLLIKILKNKAECYPQVELNSFLKIKSDEIYSSKLQIFLKIFRIENWFDYYRAELDGGTGFFYVPRMREYPLSIVRHQVNESYEILKSSKMKNGLIEKKILFICGREIIEDDKVISVYKKIIEKAKEFGFQCYLKDHPNLKSRLNLRINDVNEIDPNKPVEFVEDIFAMVIGVASTGLLNFENKAISIIKLLHDNNKVEEINRRLTHLTSMPNGKGIKIPVDIEEMIQIMKKYKNIFDNSIVA